MQTRHIGVGSIGDKLYARAAIVTMIGKTWRKHHTEVGFLVANKLFSLLNGGCVVGVNEVFGGVEPLYNLLRGIVPRCGDNH